MTNTQQVTKAGLSNWYPGFDKWLVFAFFMLLGVSMVMVTSASITVAAQRFNDPLFFATRHFFHITLGLLISVFVFKIPIRFLERISMPFLSASIFLLVLVLIPGVGHEVNGSSRWVGFGFLTVQVSEVAKLAVIIYLSSYIVRHKEEISKTLSGFLKPFLLLSFIAALLLLEPDFGAAVVIFATCMGMMFLSGSKLRWFLLLAIVMAALFAALAISSPYRLQRLTSFLNPWEDQFSSGYQLTQALIAFGRGEWLGVGLGNSVQKLFYLPEAHTDFLFAVVAEEMGLVGVVAIISLFILLVGRAFYIGRKALREEQHFAGILSFGLALWLGIQTLISIGVNSGALPTKGLTLPLMSYGGSSMIISIVVVALLLRVDYEARMSWVPNKRWTLPRQP